MEREKTMYLEFNWTANAYQFRFGDTFTDVQGYRSADSLDDARWILSTAKLKLGKKTDSRTWAIELA
jgi:hypothetical protein